MNKHAFTLIELIAVIMVIAIIVGIALPRFSGVQDEALITKAKVELRTIQSALESLNARWHDICLFNTCRQCHMHVTVLSGRSHAGNVVQSIPADGGDPVMHGGDRFRRPGFRQLQHHQENRQGPP